MKRGQSKRRPKATVSAPQQVSRYIRELMEADGLSPGDSLPSERQLADELGVSHLTVRKGLATLVDSGQIERRVGKGTYVADPHRQRPIKTAPAVDYCRIAVAMATGDITRPFTGHALLGIRRVLSQDDYALELMATAGEGYDAELRAWAKQRAFDGLIFQGYLSKQDIQRLREDQLPFVSVGVNVGEPSAPHVRFDYEDLLHQLVKEAYRFNHRELALVTWEDLEEPRQPQDEPDQIASAYSTAARQFNLLASASRHIKLPGILQPDPALVDTAAVFELDPMPTCFVVNDEIVAAALMRDLEAQGFHVPDDVSVVSIVDSTPHAHRVPLTAADACAEGAQVCEKAAAMLRRMMAGEPLDQVEQRHRCTVHFKASLAAAPSAAKRPRSETSGRRRSAKSKGRRSAS